MELGATFTEVTHVIEYPFRCRPKPRMTGRSIWKNKNYFEWVASVQAMTPRDIQAPPLALGLVIKGGLRGGTDVSNCFKAVEDALRGYLYTDDNCKIVTRTFAAYVPDPSPSFVVILGR